MATVTGTRRLLDISGNNISTAVSLEAEGTLLDSNGQSGASNQVLISTATGVDWVDGSGSSIIGGPYLPLSAGSGSPLTGALNILIPGDPKLILQSTSGDTSDWNYINFVGRDTVRDGYIGTDGGGDMQVYSDKNSSYIQLGSNGILMNGGNVGIGTTSPNYPLEVIGEVGFSDWVYASKYYPTSSTTDILMQTGAGRSITLDPTSTGKVLIPNGNVGIGTTSPTADLHIQGSSATDLPVLRVGGFGNSGSKLELAETLTSGAMNYGFSFFNDGNGSNTLIIKAHNNSTTGVTAITINRSNSLTTFSTVPVVGTRAAGDNTTRAASTAFVTAAITAAVPTVNNGTLTMTTTTGLDGGATFTANQSGTSTFAVSLDLSEITLSAGLDATATSLSLDLSEFGAAGTLVGTDEFIVLDGGAERKKAANAIGLSIFNNDPGFTTNIGDITAVVAGTGLTGGGTSGSVTLNVAGGTYTPYNDIRSLGVEAFTNGANPNITTAQVMDEIDSDGGFDSYSSVFKTSWSYAGNYNLTDAGRFTETAGSSWITWTDNSSDSTRGNVTTLAIAPNTGGSAGKVFIYNDQGSGYSPGWREVWTSTSDGAGSGLDADLLDGQQGSYYLDYANFTGTPTIPSVGNGQIDGRTSGLGLSGSMDATANQSGNTTFTVTSNATTSATANTIAYRNSSRDLNVRLLRSDYTNQSTISGAMAFRVNDGTDNYTRYCNSTSAIRTFLGVPASGDLNSYLLNTTDTFTGTLTINGSIKGNGQQLILNAGESANYATGQTAENVYANAEAGLIVSSSPDNWSSGWAGRNTTYINKADGTSSFTGKISVQGSNVIEIDQGTSSFNHVKVLSTFGSKLFSSTNYGYILESSSTAANPVTFRFDNDRYRIYSGANGEALTVLKNKNVGIGTTSPGYKLDVRGNAAFIGGNQQATDLYVHATNTAGAPARTASIKMKGYEGRAIGTFFRDVNYDADASGVVHEWFAGINYNGNFARYSIGFDATDGTPTPEYLADAKLTVTSLGDVGIGTTDPGAKFHVEDPTVYMGTPPDVFKISQRSPEITFQDLTSYVAIDTKYQNSAGYTVATYTVQNNPGGAFCKTTFDTGGPGGSVMEQKQNSFHWTVNNSQKLTLNSLGYLGINDTTPGYSLDVNGNGRFTSTVTATNFILSSDERLKENIEKVCNNKIKVDWKTFELKADKGQKRYGVIAQELEKTNPEFVREDVDGFKSVAYIDLLIAKIAELEARLEKLEK